MVGASRSCASLEDYARRIVYETKCIESKIALTHEAISRSLLGANDVELIFSQYQATREYSFCMPVVLHNLRRLEITMSFGMRPIVTRAPVRARDGREGVSGGALLTHTRRRPARRFSRCARWTPRRNSR